MKTYKVRFEKAAQKFLDKQDKNQRLRLYKAIYRLPDGTDIKKKYKEFKEFFIFLFYY